MRILVTGGCGFIGSHQVVSLLAAGHEVVVVDDLSNAKREALHRAESIGGVAAGTVEFHEIDVCDGQALRDVVGGARLDAAIHFAARKHVHESVAKPLEYHRVNIGGLVSLTTALEHYGVRTLVYSSSGSIYGDTDQHPIPETAPPRPTNPYSRTKAMGEQILRDLCVSDVRWQVTALRYFNPAGAHPSGLLGEDPTGLRTNLLPVLMDAAAGETNEVSIMGDDYDTPDGTAVRDYVHVMDVADAHLRALDRKDPGFRALNIGRGVGVSVLDLLAAVERASGSSIRRRIEARRPGDVASLYGDTTLATVELGLDQPRSLDEICSDAWRWVKTNPQGYQPLRPDDH